MIEVNGLVVVIDAGPDFRQQMLQHRVSHIDAVLLTHGHMDHIGGLDDVRPINYQMQCPLDIYAEKFVIDELKQMYAYVFAANKYPGIPEFRPISIGMNAFEINQTIVTPIRVWHHQLPVLGFRIGKMAYITDANFIDDAEMEKLMGLDVLIINALREESHMSHFSLSETLQVISRLKPAKAFITHISHQMGLHHQVNKVLPPNVSLAYDGLVLSL
jgi:phosphoribosyl 1,2-cyclic phosphate phosphodiesterase